MHRTTRAAAFAAVYLATYMSALSVSDAHVNRPLADALTSRYNEEELQQLRSGDGGGHQLSVRRLDEPRSASPRGETPRPVWSYLRR